MGDRLQMVAIGCFLLLGCGEGGRISPDPLPPAGSFHLDQCELGSASTVEKTSCAFVTVAFFKDVKTRPLIGRLILPEEFRSSGGSVILLSNSIWQRRFGAAPAMVGRVLQVNGRPLTVIGIMPKSFEYPPGVEAWVAEPAAPQ